MRELFDDVPDYQPMEPRESARQGTAPPQRKRFYTGVTVTDAEGGFAVLLDGKGIRTPARRNLVAPRRSIADAIATEWDAQREVIDPGSMPLTRLANSIIDGVADRSTDVADEIVKYAGSDLLFYRADHPEALVKRESQHWDPVLDWINETFGARFMLAEGVMHVRQSDSALDAVRAAVPTEPWALGALHAATTLTGSALLALALAHGFRDVDVVWAATNVGEDWNMERWGRDDVVLARRAVRFTELQAAAKVLAA